MYIFVGCWRQDVNLPGDVEEQKKTSVDDSDSKVTDLCHDQPDPYVQPQSELVEEQTAGGMEEHQQKQELEEDASMEASTQPPPHDVGDEANMQIVAGLHGMKTRQSQTLAITELQTDNPLYRQNERGGDDETKEGIEEKEQGHQAENVEQTIEEEEKQSGNELELKMEDSEGAGLQEVGDDTKGGKNAEEKATVEELQELQRENVGQNTEKEEIQPEEGFEKNDEDQEVAGLQKDEDEDEHTDVEVEAVTATVE